MKWEALAQFNDLLANELVGKTLISIGHAWDKPPSNPDTFGQKISIAHLGWDGDKVAIYILLDDDTNAIACLSDPIETD